MPSPRFGRCRASRMASPACGPSTRRLALVTMPRSWASKMPRSISSDRPRSSALTITRRWRTSGLAISSGACDSSAAAARPGALAAASRPPRNRSSRCSRPIPHRPGSAESHPMTTAPDSFADLLSTRARIGWGAPPAARPVTNALYEFGGGLPDPASFPYDGLIDATARMIRAEGAEALTYGEAQGDRGLRELVCHKYGLFEGLKVGPDNIIISNGSGHALSLAFSALVDPGDVILSEAPTFSGTLLTIRRHGPQVLDVPVDQDGLVVDVARERLATLRKQGRRCKLIYTIVNFQNPSGPSLFLRRRRELIDLAHAYDTLILEDDAYGA